jgi:hypothetical protein
VRTKFKKKKNVPKASRIGVAVVVREFFVIFGAVVVRQLQHRVKARIDMRVQIVCICHLFALRCVLQKKETKVAGIGSKVSLVLQLHPEQIAIERQGQFGVFDAQHCLRKGKGQTCPRTAGSAPHHFNPIPI